MHKAYFINLIMLSFKHDKKLPKLYLLNIALEVELRKCKYQPTFFIFLTYYLLEIKATNKVLKASIYNISPFQ
ncbi:hypothetical protein AVL50_09170 [Flammeovirga sp. SJP92]|nr:hypothetical protein AVL50_09170 [Flammeovirga sp. SJP92]